MHLESSFRGFRTGFTAVNPIAVPLGRDSNVADEVATTNSKSAIDQVRTGCEYLRGIETAIGSGERDLGNIQKGSRQFYSASLATPKPQDTR